MLCLAPSSFIYFSLSLSIYWRVLVLGFPGLQGILSQNPAVSWCLNVSKRAGQFVTLSVGFSVAEWGRVCLSLCMREWKKSTHLFLVSFIYTCAHTCALTRPFWESGTLHGNVKPLIWRWLIAGEPGDGWFRSMGTPKDFLSGGRDPYCFTAHDIPDDDKWGGNAQSMLSMKNHLANPQKLNASVCLYVCVKLVNRAGAQTLGDLWQACH